jgi:hydroxyacylglutathione hydrolase
MLEIIQIPVLDDNYVYLIHDPSQGVTGVVDPAVADPVVDALAKRDWRLDYILNTHHHGDHTGANEALKQKFGCTIIGPQADAARIPGIDIQVGDGDRVTLGAEEARVFDVPGHTSGHIAYWFKGSQALFCGDTLFALGCGRLFEGTPEQMWRSLEKLRALPDDTEVFCAHEYTQANARFALSIEPGNAALAARAREIDAARQAGRPTVPSTLGEERATNPFLRADDPALQQALGLDGAGPVEVFAETRRRKDHF